MIIYKAINRTTGKIYIGQTVRSLKTRRSEHLRTAQQIERQRYPTPLSLAIRQYGSGDFDWEVLEACASLQHLNERECFYIKELNTQAPNGYNQTIGGYMTNAMAELIRGRIAAGVSAVHKDPAYQARVYPKLKGAVPPNKGIPMSSAQKAKVSAAIKAVHADPTYINPNVGQKRTGDQLANVQKGHQTRQLPTGEAWTKAHGDQYTQEVRNKMREAKLGKKPANTNKIMCNETGEVFEGLTDAAKTLGVQRQSVHLQLKGKLKKVGGKYTFRHVSK